MGERPWYGPLSPWVTDAEKNDAVNAIERDLATWRVNQAHSRPPSAEIPTRRKQSKNASKNAKNKEREKR